MSVLGEELALTISERKILLDPYRDLEPIFDMREALKQVGYDIKLIGNDIADLFIGLRIRWGIGMSLVKIAH